MSTIGKILFVAIIVLLIVIGIIVFKCVKKSNDYLKKSGQTGTAVIVGYDSESTSTNVRLSVKVLNSDDEHSYNLKGIYNVKKIDGSLDERYPHFSIGDEVKVIYAKKKTLGIEMLDIRIDQSQYDYPKKQEE